MGQHIVYFDHWPHDIIKAAMADALGQAETEYLQQPTHLVGQINRLVSSAFRLLKSAL